jgi:hypothetical protein
MLDDPKFGKSNPMVEDWELRCLCAEYWRPRGGTPDGMPANLASPEIHHRIILWLDIDRLLGRGARSGESASYTPSEVRALLGNADVRARVEAWFDARGARHWSWPKKELEALSLMDSLASGRDSATARYYREKRRNDENRRKSKAK